MRSAVDQFGQVDPGHAPGPDKRPYEAGDDQEANGRLGDRIRRGDDRSTFDDPFSQPAGHIVEHGNDKDDGDDRRRHGREPVEAHPLYDQEPQTGIADQTDYRREPDVDIEAVKRE